MGGKIRSIFSYNTLLSVLCCIYVWILIHYSVAMWESRQRYGIIFLTLTLMIAALQGNKKDTFLCLKDSAKSVLIGIIFTTILVSGLYFWIEYPSLVWERAGSINGLDASFSAVFIFLTILLTWTTSGPVIPTVTLFFFSYGLFGHLIPGTFFGHPPFSFVRFMEISCAEINGVFGALNQIAATWIAIFSFYAGLLHGFGGLDFILRCTYNLVGSKKTAMPQVAVLSSMGFGCMSGSAGANAVSTGAFTIPTMKRYGVPPAIAAAIESVASSGGQIMPPILGAVAFVMCDYLGMYYFEILLASLFPSIIYFGSTMLSVYFVSKQHIDPNKEVDLPAELRGKMGLADLARGVPIAVSLITLLYVFIVYKVNILVGGFYTIVAFLISQFIFELVNARGRPVFILTFLKGVYEGTLKGAMMIVPIGAMLGSLGIVVRVLTTTGLGEKISYNMATIFGSNLLLLLLSTMVICIFFGMAVTTVAAYILAVTLAAPALLKMGIPPLVTHFAVFYWAMLSAITPPVAAVCVITSGIAGANFMKTSWESMKIGNPKFLLPFIFILKPELLTFSLKGLTAFIICIIGFGALSAALQSGWGRWRQTLLFLLSIGTLFAANEMLTYLLAAVTVILFTLFWKFHSEQAFRFKNS
jgi:TRAP transporter 4TM/12TM fusion protein